MCLQNTETPITHMQARRQDRGRRDGMWKWYWIPSLGFACSRASQIVKKHISIPPITIFSPTYWWKWWSPSPLIEYVHKSAFLMIIPLEKQTSIMLMIFNNSLIPLGSLSSRDDNWTLEQKGCGGVNVCNSFFFPTMFSLLNPHTNQYTIYLCKL